MTALEYLDRIESVVRSYVFRNITEEERDRRLSEINLEYFGADYHD